MKDLPKVSIIIPTYNRANYLPQAIESALSQDYPNLEVVVSDNCSTDETPEIVKKYMNDEKFRYFRNKENIGMVRNWRKAVFEYSTGDWFLILSDDDYFIDNKYISKAMGLAKKDEKIVLIYANGYILNEETKEMQELKLPFSEIEDGKKIFLSREKIKPQDFILCNVIFNKELAVKLNAFSNPYNICCDSELFLKMCLLGKVGIIKNYVSIYRRHSNNYILNVYKNNNLSIACLDYVIEPYFFAKKEKLLSKEEAKKWEREVLFVRLIKTAIALNVINTENKEILENFIIEKLNLNMKDVLKKVSLSLRLKYYLSKQRTLYSLVAMVWKMFIK